MARIASEEGMDTMPVTLPTEKHAPLVGLDPAKLLQQGLAEDTLVEADRCAFSPPSIGELASSFPQFEILELIGQGGMGAVYKVRQKDLDRVVALKVLPPGIGQSAEFSSRFTREAKALAKLNHPGIVTLHEFGQQDGLYFILMEFVDGLNLAQLMKAGRVEAREALAIVPQICDALQYAHDQGIVHRDIKPENILLDRQGRVKVADFGIAKVVAAVCDPIRSGDTPVPGNQTLAGKVIGTPQYMAPEQIEHPGAVDHRADIYALGVVFYQMLTGELPSQDLQAPSRKIHIDVRLDEIVLKAMEKNPELRYQQASVLKTRVEDLGVSASLPPPPVAKRSVGRLIAMGCGAALLLVCLLVTVGTYLISTQDDRESSSHTLPVVGSQPVRVDDESMLSQPPALRFVGLQHSSQELWHPDGSLVTDPEELALIREIGRTSVFLVGRGEVIKGLKFFFSHPSMESWHTAEIEVIDDAGNLIERPVSGLTGGTETKETIHSGRLFWFIISIAVDISKPVNIRLNYTVGPLERVREYVVRKNDYGFSDGGTILSAVGQTVDGKAFLSLDVDKRTEGIHRFGAEAVTKHGRIVQPSGKGSRGGTILTNTFEFNEPISNIPKFRIGTRPLKTVVWKNVAVSPKRDETGRAMHPPNFELEHQLRELEVAILEQKEALKKRQERLEEIIAAKGIRDNEGKIESQHQDYEDYVNAKMDVETQKSLIEMMNKKWEETAGVLSRKRPAPSGSFLITEFGEFKSEHTPWSARISAEDRKLHLIHRHRSGESRIPLAGWQANHGWFVFIEDEANVWAYDGGETIMLIEDSDKKTSFSQTETISRRLPDALISRIPPAIRARIGTSVSLGAIGVRPEGVAHWELMAVYTAESWLAAIDGGHYVRSWKEASELFQKSITAEAWDMSLIKFRKPLGAVKTRKFLTAKSAEDLPGEPPGKYRVIRFETSFAAKAEAVETVTFMEQSDGTWKAAGYFIR